MIAIITILTEHNKGRSIHQVMIKSGAELPSEKIYGNRLKLFKMGSLAGWKLEIMKGKAWWFLFTCGSYAYFKRMF